MIIIIRKFIVSVSIQSPGEYIFLCIEIIPEIQNVPNYFRRLVVVKRTEKKKKKKTIFFTVPFHVDSCAV